ncbi:MAG: HipA domain-containing protein [Gelidibacter sp.]|nr:HipA domain-containing protein [Gelidibacter sp.]
MKKNKCLFCYKELTKEDENFPSGKVGYHVSCSKKMFGKAIPPEFPYAEKDMVKLAEQVIKSQRTITGVQPKLSLGIQKFKDKNITERFTIVGVFGEYILKPQSEVYNNLPEIESLTMHLAEIAKISTVKHSLIRLQSGQLAYITKRIDRSNGGKFHMEDMCQLTERLTEHKYKGSYEQIAKVILKHSENPGLDVNNFYELVLFSFLTGNNDMHLKNFSLLKKDGNYNLCPVYDLVASELIVEGDDEELALNLNGKKKKLKRKDFEEAMRSAKIEEKAIANIFKKIAKLLPKWHDFIELSFLPDEVKIEYHQLINSKSMQMGLL